MTTTVYVAYYHDIEESIVVIDGVFADRNTAIAAIKRSIDTVTDGQHIEAMPFNGCDLVWHDDATGTEWVLSVETLL